MNCHEFRQSLEQGIEGRSPLTADMRRHASDCPNDACATMLRHAEALDAVIGAWRAARTRVDVTDRVAVAWRDAQRPAVSIRAASATSNQRAGGKGSALTVAICALGALLLAVAVLSTSSRPSRPIADDPVGPDPESAPLDNGLGIEQLVDQNPDANDDADEALETVGRSYVGLVQNATNVVSDMVALAFCGDQELEDPTPAVHWVDDWRTNLQPVREEVDGTVDEILETIPNQRFSPPSWLPDLTS